MSDKEYEFDDWTETEKPNYNTKFHRKIDDGTPVAKKKLYFVQITSGMFKGQYYNFESKKKRDNYVKNFVEGNDTYRVGERVKRSK